MNTIFEPVPGKPRIFKDGKIWRVESGSSGSGRASGSYEFCLEQALRQVTKRAEFFSRMQKRGKYFPHQPVVLCGTAYEWFECPTCGMKIYGTGSPSIAQWAHDKEARNGNLGGELETTLGKLKWNKK